MMITVFTPTYNRAYTLPRLYQSLVDQTYTRFEWLIVDDGSTDSTQELIESMKQENKIPIHYVYCQNAGKQRAINKGVLLSKEELFFIVDSDDYLTIDALEHIYKEWDQLANKEIYAGLCFRKILKSTQKILGAPFRQIRFDSDSLEISNEYASVDRAEVFRTEVLRKFPFPDIDGEKFIPEALIWHRIAASSLKLRFIDYGIYVCEYLVDGLSKNFKTNLKRNSKGFALYYRELLGYKQIPIRQKIKALVRFLQCQYYSFLKSKI